jgi:PHS family inorganic phosphate transporter-like MFS transporter
MMAIVFAMQGFGILAAAIVSFVVIQVYQEEIMKDPTMLDHVWRLVLGLGAIPAFIALYVRLTIPETPHYAIETELNVHKARIDNEQPSEKNTVQPFKLFHKHTVRSNITIKGVTKYFSRWKNGKILLAVCVAWFCVDICFYGLGMNKEFILDHNKELSSDKNNPYYALRNQAVDAIITTATSIPGYWASVFLIDRIGRKPIMWLGFTISGVLLIVLGVLDNGVERFARLKVRFALCVFTIVSMPS